MVGVSAGSGEKYKEIRKTADMGKLSIGGKNGPILPVFEHESKSATHGVPIWVPVLHSSFVFTV
jgi:hypothetical protein